MLSIIPFDRVTSSQASGMRDTERPFKAYPRVPTSLPTNSYYGPFTPPTFVGSVNIPASHTSASLKRLEEGSSGSSMDPNSHHSSHHYGNLMQAGGSTAEHIPHLMDISSHASMMGRHPVSSPTMPPTSHHSLSSLNIKSEPTSSRSSLMHNNSSPPMHHGLLSTPVSSHHSLSTPVSSHHSLSTPVSSHHHSTQPMYSGAASHHSTGSSASSGSPPNTLQGNAAGSSTNSDSSPGGSSDHQEENHSHIPPKKRPLSTPTEAKDGTYWEKRKKNNESAKRSRDARRMKEEQIAMRVVYLEQENLQLRTEVSLLKSEIEKLRCMLYNS